MPDGLLIGDGTGDIGFGTHDIFFDIAHHEVVLALVDQQIGFGTELERHIVARGTYPEMYITRNEFLLVADEVGQEVEMLWLNFPAIFKSTLLKACT